MESNLSMEKFKEKIVLRAKWNMIGAILIFAVLMGANIIRKMEFPSLVPENIESGLTGFITGAVTVVEVVLIRGWLNARKALKDETKLKQLYIEENDERKKIIEMKALSVCFRISMFIFILGIVVTSVIDVRICGVLLAMAMVIVVLKVILLGYYKKKL